MSTPIREFCFLVSSARNKADRLAKQMAAGGKIYSSINKHGTLEEAVRKISNASAGSIRSVRLKFKDGTIASADEAASVLKSFILHLNEYSTLSDVDLIPICMVAATEIRVSASHTISEDVVKELITCIHTNGYVAIRSRFLSMLTPKYQGADKQQLSRCNISTILIYLASSAGFKHIINQTMSALSSREAASLLAAYISHEVIAHYIIPGLEPLRKSIQETYGSKVTAASRNTAYDRLKAGFRANRDKHERIYMNYLENAYSSMQALQEESLGHYIVPPRIKNRIKNLGLITDLMEQALASIQNNNKEAFARLAVRVEEHLNENNRKPELSSVIRSRAAMRNNVGYRLAYYSILIPRGDGAKQKVDKEKAGSRLTGSLHGLASALGPLGLAAYYSGKLGWKVAVPLYKYLARPAAIGVGHTIGALGNLTLPVVSQVGKLAGRSAWWLTKKLARGPISLLKLPFLPLMAGINHLKGKLGSSLASSRAGGKLASMQAGFNNIKNIFSSNWSATKRSVKNSYSNSKEWLHTADTASDKWLDNLGPNLAGWVYNTGKPGWNRYASNYNNRHYSGRTSTNKPFASNAGRLLALGGPSSVAGVFGGSSIGVQPTNATSSIY
jgi:hypothetical protein